MGNNMCNIIKDLLPLYVDGVVSEESNQFINGHLKECEKCANLFQKMKTDIRLTYEADLQKEEMKTIKKIKRKLWRKSFLIAGLFLLLFVLSFGGVLLYSSAKGVTLCEDEVAFTYMVNPYIVDDLERMIVRGTSGGIGEVLYRVELKSVPSRNPEDYLALRYRVGPIQKHSIIPVRYTIDVCSSSGKYQDRILAGPVSFTEVLEESGISVGNGVDYYIYIGGLSESEQEELKADMSVVFKYSNFPFHNRKISLTGQEDGYEQWICSLEDYNRLKEAYPLLTEGELPYLSGSDIAEGLGHMTKESVHAMALTNMVLPMDLERFDDFKMTKSEMRGKMVFSYLYEIINWEEYVFLVETEYPLYSGEDSHKKDNLAGHAYLVDKKTMEKLLCIGEAKGDEELWMQ